MGKRTAYSLLFLIVICLRPACAQPSVRDSLQRLYAGAHDTLKVQLLNKISRQLEGNNPDSALILGDSALKMATRIHYDQGIGLSYASIGSSHTTSGKYDQGIRNLLSALKVFEKLKNKRAICNTYNSIANAYVGLANHPKAYEFFLKAYDMASQPPRNEYMVAVTSVGVGGILLEEKKYSEAIGYFKTAEKYFGENNITNYEGMATSMIGEAYFRDGDLQAAEKYYRKATAALRKCNDTYGLASTLNSLGTLELERKNYDQAAAYFREALLLNLQRKAWDNIQNTALKLSQTLELQNNPARALEYYKLHVRYKDSVISIERNKSIAESEAKYQTGKREQELKLKNMELEASQMQVTLRSRLLFVFAAAVVVAMILLFFVFKQYREKKKANLELTIKNEEIEKQKTIIEEKNKDITDSINYARHIQQAIIPPGEKMKSVLRDLFVIFMPKDIVSGDFYMFEQTPACAYLAVVDCTGHGVPGAMLSVFANSSLKNIIAGGRYETNPAGILTELCQQFKNNLHAGQRNVMNDGADIGICIIHQATKQLYFAGARHDLHLVRSGAISEYAADRHGISGSNTGEETRYTNHQVALQPGDKYYLFSDGYADQFGGPRGKKFKHRQLESKLRAGSQKPFEVQAQLLEEEFMRWKGNLEQLDDVTVLGFEVLI